MGGFSLVGDNDNELVPARSPDNAERCSYYTKSDDEGPLPRVGSNTITKADINERRKALRKAGVRFPAWKVDAAVVRVMRDVILYGCLNIEPAQKAKEGYFSDKFNLRELASEIKVALPWSLRLATDDLIQVILATEGVKYERTSKGGVVSIQLGQEVARHYRKGVALRQKKTLISEGWYREDEVANWRQVDGGRGSQQPKKVISSSSDGESDNH